jgi:hypothetical protein
MNRVRKNLIKKGELNATPAQLLKLAKHLIFADSIDVEQKCCIPITNSEGYDDCWELDKKLWQKRHKKEITNGKRHR